MFYLLIIHFKKKANLPTLDISLL